MRVTRLLPHLQNQDDAVVRTALPTRVHRAQSLAKNAPFLATSHWTPGGAETAWARATRSLDGTTRTPDGTVRSLRRAAPAAGATHGSGVSGGHRRRSGHSPLSRGRARVFTRHGTTPDPGGHRGGDRGRRRRGAGRRRVPHASSHPDRPLRGLPLHAVGPGLPVPGRGVRQDHPAGRVRRDRTMRRVAATRRRRDVMAPGCGGARVRRGRPDPVHERVRGGDTRLLRQVPGGTSRRPSTCCAATGYRWS